MSSYKINKAVQAYFDTTIEFKILEKDIEKVTKKKNTLIINTPSRVIIKSIR